MRKEMTYKRILNMVRWAARILGVGFVGLFLYLFVSQGGLGEFIYLTGAEKLRLTFLPVVFTIGLAVSWKRELLGGAIMILSVIGFNLVGIASKQHFSGEMECAVVLIPGLILALLPFLSRTKSKA